MSVGDRPQGVDLLVDDVSVRYGQTTALDRFTLSVPAGQIVAVVGPSGSGKSTLLRAVAGLEPLAAGRVVLGGRDLAAVPTHLRGLGLMFQDHGLFTHLDVAANIGYGLRVGGAGREQEAARVDELLALVGLQGFEARRPSQLSGGEAQRVALARALAPRPGLLMLDEPLGSLDRALRDQLTGDLRRLLTGLGQTALHVTHDQAEAFAVADRVVVMAAGRPVAVGSPADLWADPGSRFVAEFLGHPNVWSVTVGPDGEVSLAGHRLGRVGARHPLRCGGVGERWAVLPVTGVRLQVGLPGPEPDAPTGARIEAVVADTVFRQGVHDVEARVEARVGPPSPSGPANGLAEVLPSAPALHFTTAEPLRVGQRVTLVVDPATLRPLTDR